MKTNKETQKKVRFALSFLFALTVAALAETSAMARSVTLQWLPNNESDIVGYRIYYKAASTEVPFDGAGALEGIAPVDVANQTTATLTGLDPAKDYYFAVTAYNTLGKESPYSEVKPVLSVKDVTSPTVIYSSHVDGGSVSGTVALTATAVDDTGVTSIELYQNEILIAAGNLPQMSYNWNTMSVPNGTYTLFAKAYDAAGNIGEATVAVTVANDVMAPSIAIASPAPAGIVSGTISLTANATDDIGVTKVDFFINGTLKSTSASAPYSFKWDTATVATGSYTITARAYDASGKVGQSNELVYQVADTTAPTVSFLSPTFSTVSGNSVAISASASDNVAVAKLELYVDNSLKSTFSTNSFNIGWNFPLGVHTITVKAYDAANNVKTISKAINRVY